MMRVGLVLLACLLYLPYLANERIFDDLNLFGDFQAYAYALKPFDISPRTFPYFTLGITHVLNPAIALQRSVSLVLHIGSALLVFAIVRVMLGRIRGFPEDRGLMLASLAALAFALHPVAVYGAAYLTQRTILFATLFSLASLYFFLRACIDDTWAGVRLAAIFYTFAVFSKEHAIMLPLAVVAAAPLVVGDMRSRAVKIGAFLALCAPAGMLILLNKVGIIGTSYEPASRELIASLSEIPLTQTALGAWIVSVVTQMGLFFQYLRLWLLPDTSLMSVDIRVDFVGGWVIPLILLKVSAFLVCPLVAVFLLRRRGLAAVAAYGFLFAWILYFTELISVRFQEPFVLYRSYLWAPGFLLIGVSALGKLPVRYTRIFLLLAVVMLIYAARDRLESLSNELVAWQDAVAKLPANMPSGSDRTLFNLGVNYSNRKQMDQAEPVFVKIIKISPANPMGYFGRGLVRLQRGDAPAALADLDMALMRHPSSFLLGQILYDRGLALERMGRKSESLASFRQSALVGYPLGKMRVEMMGGEAVPSSASTSMR